nr:immunoglobulin heavy chain junction region [Macaca mulatta]
CAREYSGNSYFVFFDYW